MQLIRIALPLVRRLLVLAGVLLGLQIQFSQFLQCPQALFARDTVSFYLVAERLVQSM